MPLDEKYMSEDCSKAAAYQVSNAFLEVHSAVLHFCKKCYTLGLHYTFSGVVLVQVKIHIFHQVYFFFIFQMIDKVNLIMSELKMTTKCGKLNEICKISAYTSTSKKCSATLKCYPKV